MNEKDALTKIDEAYASGKEVQHRDTTFWLLKRAGEFFAEGNDDQARLIRVLALQIPKLK